MKIYTDKNILYEAVANIIATAEKRPLFNLQILKEAQK